ncbi:MAG: phage tail fiber protein [Proteobacteria bacterium]|nr:phage tail fiber protein [Pseudomonadota bacterium]
MYKISYTGDGKTAEFAFDFEFFQPRDVHVAIDDTVLDPAQYSLVTNETMKGGTIGFATAPNIGTRIDIFRRIYLDRFIDYQPTAKIDPEDLNGDFNFLLQALRDRNELDIDIDQWQNLHDNVMTLMNNTMGQIQYAVGLIQDKLSGGAVLGLYNNLLSVLADALPDLINDYGNVTDPALNQNADDYGKLV